MPWTIALGRFPITGPGTMWRDQPLLLHSWVASVAVVIGFVASRSMSSARLMPVAALLVVGWVGELVGLLVFGRLLAGELTPAVAPWVWALATGGPLQPLAAIAGAVAERVVRRRRRPASPPDPCDAARPGATGQRPRRSVRCPADGARDQAVGSRPVRASSIVVRPRTVASSPRSSGRSK